MERNENLKTQNKNSTIYSNRISRELLPGMIKPLVWSINIPVVNSSWKKLFKELTGSAADQINIENLAQSFYFRAYFNMSVVGDFFELLGISRDALEVLSGISKSPSKGIFKPSSKILRYLPRMTVFGFRLYFFHKQIEQFLKRKTKQYKEIDTVDLAALSLTEILDIIDRLIIIHQESSYVVILTQILNSIYNRAVKRIIKNDLDLKYYLSLEKNLLLHIDPERFIAKLNRLFYQLPEEIQEIIPKTCNLDLGSDPKFSLFGKEFDIFIRRFGHLSDNANDFSQITWKENPELTIKMIMYHNSFNNLNTKNLDSKSINIKEKNLFSRFLINRSKKFQIYRRLVGYVYNFGFGLFRKLFLNVGKILVDKNVLKSKKDIFYLNYKEIKAFSENPNLKMEYTPLIEKRKQKMNDYKFLDLPEIILDDLPINLVNKRIIAKTLSGVASSAGRYSGIAKVVLSVEEFDKIKDGDVLIIPYSDPSWTSIFSKAGAIISESGGLLSHCSIVAREYRIPAIVSVHGALQIKDGTKILVDGFTGQIKIIDN